MRIHITTLSAASLALSLVGCASQVQVRKLDAEAVYVSRETPPTRLMVERTQYVSQAFSPEGLRDSVDATDHRYFLVHPDGHRTDLPFLDSQRTERPDWIQHLYHDKASAAWVSVNITERTHLQHEKDGGMLGWRNDPDEYIPIRIKVFTQDKLLSVRDIEACNPAYLANPPVHYDKSASRLQYCARAGSTVYNPLDGSSRLVSTATCCPKVDDPQTYRPGRYARDYLTE